MATCMSSVIALDEVREMGDLHLLKDPLSVPFWKRHTKNTAKINGKNMCRV